MGAIDRVVDRARRAPPVATDAAMAAAIFAVGFIEVTVRHDQYPATRPSAVALVAVAMLAVTLRRFNPLIAYGLATVAQVVGDITKVGYGIGFAPALVGAIILYTVAERCSVRVSLLVLTAMTVYPLLWPPYSFPWKEVLFYVLFYVPSGTLPWFAGRARARRRAIAAELSRSADELRAERDRLTRSAVTAERVRIARELHVLVSRGIEWMNSETHAARQILGDPARASGSISQIEEQGRSTLVDMRRLLVVLRQDSDGAEPVDGGPPTESPAFEADGIWQDARLTGEEAFPAPLLERARLRFKIPWVVDASVVLGLAALALAERLLPPYQGSYLRRPIDLALMWVMLGALLLRRVRPLLAFFVVMSVIFGWVALWKGGANTADLALLVALYSLAAYRGIWWGIIAIAVNVVAYYPGCAGVCAVGTAAGDVFIVIAGVAVFEGRRLRAKLREQIDLIRRTREERVRLAVVEERSRIARDVHDMVAHGVTLMVIQAGAARWLVDADPRKADHALGSVERAGQEALRELGSLVGSLDEHGAGAEPLPTDEQLSIHSLVARQVEAGMNVEMVVVGEPRPLDVGLELSLYRIVQEALTNIRKHAPGARAWVKVAYNPDGVQVEVTNAGDSHGEPVAGTVPGAGQGLLGIAERAALFGGRAEAGPIREGGFRVAASLADERVPV